MTAATHTPYPTAFIGREDELTDILDLLADPTCRLLTLVGPGGIGKTRLSLEAAHRAAPRYEDGIAFVELAGVADADYLAPALAAAFHLQMGAVAEDLTGRGGDPQPDRGPAALVVDYLRVRHMLLVLDNFEHLLDGVPLIDTILTEAPQVQIITTTRVVLNSAWEHIYDVRGLETPTNGDSDDLGRYPAIALFADRAQRVQRHFSLDEAQTCVVRICQLLDGMPLGIELAASWLRVLSCDDLTTELERGLDFLEHRQPTVNDRHASLRAVFEHSWNLLDATEQESLQRLAVFHGNFTRDAARAVAGASLTVLSGLVDKSLLRAYTSGRYDLHELVRQFVSEKLFTQTHTAGDTVDRHTAYYCAYVHEQEPALKGSQQAEGLRAIEAEIDNIRGAFLHAVAHQDAGLMLQTIEGLGRYYETRLAWTEGAAVFKQALNGWEGDPVVRGWLMAWVGRYTGRRGQRERGITILKDALALLRQHDHPSALAFCLSALANEVQDLRHMPLEEKLVICQESLAIYRSLGDRFGETTALRYIAFAYRTAEEFDRAREYYAEAIQVARAIDNPMSILTVVGALGGFERDLGNYDAARQLFDESLRLAEAINNIKSVANTLERLCNLEHRQGHFAEAQALAERLYDVARDLGDRYTMGEALKSLGWVKHKTGDHLAAKQAWEETLAIAEALDHQHLRESSLIGLGAVASVERRFADARRIGNRLLDIYRETDNQRGEGIVLSNLSFHAIHQGDYAQARRDALASIALLEQDRLNADLYPIPIAHLGHAQVGLGELPAAMQSYRRALRLLWEQGRLSISLEIVVGIAHVLALTGDLDRALEIMTFAFNHPSLAGDSRVVFEPLWRDLQAEAPPDVLAAAQDRARARELDQLVDELLNDPALNALADQAESSSAAAPDESAGSDRAPAEQPLVDPLTERELEVLALVAQGKSNRQIAADLVLALGTVKTHVHNLTNKLGAQNRTEAAMRGRELGLI